MTDYTSEGAIPVEDAAVENPPTVDEVLEEQRQRDDLPDPSENPRRQHVLDEDETSSATQDGEDDGDQSLDPEADLSQLLIDQAIANNVPPDPDVSSDPTESAGSDAGKPAP